MLEHFSRGLGEAEAGRDVTHDAHAPVIDLAGEHLAVRLIDEAQHRRGMSMVDEFMRQEGVQQRLDRRVGRARIQQVQALHIDHGFVGQLIERAELAQRLELHRGQTLRLDIGHVPAGALDRDHLCSTPRSSLPRVLTEVLPPPCSTSTGRGQQPRGVDAQREILGNALLGVGLDRVTRASSFHLLCMGDVVAKNRGHRKR